jgi:hypothetical protein
MDASNRKVYALRGHVAPSRLLCDLLDAHEIVMSSAHTAGAYGQQIDSSSVQDFAVGQVLLTTTNKAVPSGSSW